MSFFQTVVRSNLPVRITASVHAGGPGPSLNLLYKNHANPAEDGWLDIDQATIGRNIVFDEVGHHDLFVGAADVSAAAGTQLRIQLVDPTGSVIQLHDISGVPVPAHVAFTGPAAAAAIRVFSFL
jgi:hypothetical protein